MKILNRIIGIAVACAAIMSANVYAESDTNDKAYEEAAEILSGLNMVSLDSANKDNTVTRAEFADMVIRVLGWNTASNEDKVKEGKYLGYTNDPEFDENGDWVWKKDSGETGETQTYKNATPFHDVQTTHEYWDSIKLAAAFGFMNGDENSYFMPDKPIKMYEAAKVLVYVCGGSSYIGGNYPDGVISEAGKLELWDNIKVGAYNEDVSERNAAVMLCNALDAEIYTTKYINTYKTRVEQSDITLLEYFRKIYKIKGIVTANSITALDSSKGLGENNISIENEQFICADIAADDFLGKNVEAYYTEDKSTENNIIFIRATSKNREFTVKNDEIIGYSDYYLSYWKPNGGKDKEYIGANSSIIYNGKALKDYTDDNIVPAKGSITFLDANSDGEYETVFIYNTETVVVGGTDIENKLIYDRRNPGNKIDLSKAETEMINSFGNEISIENINENGIVSVQRTLPQQGDLLVNIKYSEDCVKGTLTAYLEGDKEITVDGQTYKCAEDFDFSELKTGQEATFYLDCDHEVIWIKNYAVMQYGYLIKIIYDDAEDVLYTKIYNVKENEVCTYTSYDKIKVNKVSQKIEKVKSNASVYDSSSDTTVHQLIKFRLNEDETLKEILTVGVDEKEFAMMSGDIAGKKMQYRNVNGLKVLIASVPLIYLDSDTKMINVPKTDFENEDCYYPINMVHDDYYTLSKVYKNDVDSPVGKVLVREQDTSSKKDVDVGKPVCMVSKVSQIYDAAEDDTGYRIDGVSTSGKFSITVTDRDLYDKVKDVHTGDLIRYEVSVKTHTVNRFERVFDAENHVMLGGINPYESTADNFISNLHVVHGEVIDKPDDGAFLTIAPYIYTSEDNKIIVGEPQSDSLKQFILRSNLYSYYLYDSATDTVTSATAADILDSASCLKGTEVVAYSFWSDPKTIYIYK